MIHPHSARLHPVALAWLLVGLVVGPGTGCSKKTSVDPISVESSGVRMRDQEVWLSESDWPGWRGPRGDGAAMDQPIVTDWSEDTNVLWSADVPGRGHASPIVIGNQVVLATALEEQQQMLVLAYERSSGEQRWSTTVHTGGFTAPQFMHSKGSYANGTAVSDGKQVYVVFLHEGHVVATALDLQGNLAWQTDLGEFRSTYGYAPSPILHRSCIIVAADHRDGGFLAAVDRDSGKMAWRTTRPAISSYSSPAVLTVAGEDQLLICGCDEVASFDPATGRKNWSCSGTTESTCGTVVTDATHVFASGGYPGSETICVRGDGSGDVVWRNKTSVYEPSLLVASEHLFTITDKGIAYCWHCETGELMWRERLRGGFSASPVLCNGLILVPSLRGETYVFEATGERYREIAKNKLGDDCYTSLALSDGQIFTRVGVKVDGKRREKLYCIGLPPDADK